MEQPQPRPLTVPHPPRLTSALRPRAGTAPTIHNTNMSSSNNVRVVARIRPLSSKELEERSSSCLQTQTAPNNNNHDDNNNNNPNSNTIRVTSEDKSFEFDRVFEPTATQEEVYEGTAGDMIRESIYKGFNGTILTYGQTGSGKTFTMGTDGSSNFDSHSQPSPSDGVIARAVHDLFRLRSDYSSSSSSSSSRVTISMSYLEIYNEKAIDLLSDDNTESLQVRDSKTCGVTVPNLKHFEVNSSQEVMALMEKAGKKRRTGSTNMNEVSSRSHAICTLNVTFVPPDREGDNDRADAAATAADNQEEEEAEHRPSRSDVLKAKLTLVDLAGSERIKRTGASGDRMKEGININKGLFVLGQVVSSLSEVNQNNNNNSNHHGHNHGSKKQPPQPHSHIPYRDSKLTRLLQDSLGGNSRTVMIACISPAESNAEETMNTLRYAERTRNIKNTAVRNVVSGGVAGGEAVVRALRKENELLKLQLGRLRDGDGVAVGAGSSLADIEATTKLKAQCSSFLAENDLLKERIRSHSDKVLEASLRADKWQAKFERIVEVAESRGVDLSESDCEMSEVEGVVEHLRKELSECQARLLETRADAAMARATAGAVIAGNCNLDSVTSGDAFSTLEMPVLEEEDDGNKDEIANELSAVSGTIEQKEAMLQQMLRERSCREGIQMHLQNSLCMLKSEMDELNTEKTQLVEQMNKNMEDNTRRKCKTAVNPVTKRLREQIKSLERRISELNQKANEHQKSLRMKAEAEKKCARLTAEISADKRRRADLQKKLKEASNEIRAEKKAAQQNAARMMKDSRKLKLELSKIKNAAEKQAAVLKRKIDEAAAKEKARLELERRRKNVEQMRSVSSASGEAEIKESRKQELEGWIDREIECSIIKMQIHEYQSQLESAMAERKRLMKRNSDTVDILQLESIEDDCNAIRAAICELENTAKESFPAYSSSNPAWRFIDSNLFKALSKQEAKHVVTYIFDVCSSVKNELDSTVAERETATELAVEAAVDKERQCYEREIMKLKMEHGEATLNLLESTQGAVSSNIMQVLASNGDKNAKSQLESTLEAYMQRCMSTGKRFKSDLDEMKESEEGMNKLMEDVTQGITFVPHTARKKKRVDYESEEEMDVLEESFEIDDSSDYEPTPTPAKRKRQAIKKPVDSPLLGENISMDSLDEDTISNLTVTKLREVCKKNNLPSTGRKNELQDRIREKLIVKKVIFEEDPNDIAAEQDVSFEEELIVKKVIFEEEPNDVETEQDVSSEEAKPAANKDGEGIGTEQKPKEPVNDFYQSLLKAPSTKKPGNTAKSTSKPKLSDESVDTMEIDGPHPTLSPFRKISKSPKRKRDSDDAVKTPHASAKKARPLGFLSSSPRYSSPPTQTAEPLGNHNRTPVMFKHTASSRKRVVAKKPTGGSRPVAQSSKKITASEKKRTKKGMNAAVHRALEQCNDMLGDL